MFTIMRADQAGTGAREQIAEIFADGFAQWLGYFSKDKKQIAAAFAHMFVLDQFCVAVKDGQVAGMAACTDCHSLAVKLDKQELRKHLGFYKGSLASRFLKNEFETTITDPPENTGSIEYVGTASAFRGQGVASQILTYILTELPFQEFLIEEVADTNIPAMSLYKKLGFQEYRRKEIPAKRAAKIGINNMISLKYTRPAQE